MVPARACGEMKKQIPSERSFGLSVGLVCLATGAVSWWYGRASQSAVLSVSGLVLVAGGLIAPGALRVPNRIWWRFAQVLGWVNARILLTVFFVVVVTPVGCAMRLFGRNPLRPAKTGTSWSSYAVGRRDTRHYEHLF